ncbi:MAG: DEAD/DEAH box helicase [Vampirovibrionales bacterium]
MPLPNLESALLHLSPPSPASIDEFLKTLTFQPDVFQTEAMKILAQNHSVVVCAPTGSGKTLIAEYAVFTALQTQKRLFYTTPLKALSNQKYRDFVVQLGPSQVGLMTGDTVINRDAPIVVMTTEIFRNMLYSETHGLRGDIEPGSILSNVQYVVLDECHYMNDAQRGTVWEESIIYCPPNIQLIALSATVANADELTRWMNHIHPTTKLVTSDFRPVPLRFFYDDRERLAPLFEQNGHEINRRFPKSTKGDRFSKKKRDYDPAALVLRLAEKDMLPAIVFTFSRNGCDNALKACNRLSILTEAERHDLHRRIEAALIAQPTLAHHPHITSLRRGFASHHAGLLPGIKVLTEELFQQGLIKAVFATETLAAGINMPARSTVITSLSKRTDDGHRSLMASEFMQMAGRAGRRGMDDIGYVVIAGSPYDTPQDAGRLALAQADPLNSQFTPTYGMVLNLLQRGTVEDAQRLIQKSFGQFTWGRRLEPLQAVVDELSTEYNRLIGILNHYGLDEERFKDLAKTRSKLMDAYRQQGVLRRELKRYRDKSSKSREAGQLVEALKKEQQAIQAYHRRLKSFDLNVDEFFKKHKRLDEKIPVLRRKIRQAEHQMTDERDIYFSQFENIHQLLKSRAYLDEHDYPTPSGHMTALLRTENPLLVTEILRSGELDHLTPGALAAMACALTFDSNRDTIQVEAHLSSEASYALKGLKHHAKCVYQWQKENRVTIPVVLNATAAPLAECWVDGMPWERLLRLTNLAEGDVVRTLRRTGDLLRQWAHLGGLPETLTHQAKLANRSLQREPVKEDEFIPPDGVVIDESTELITHAETDAPLP